MTELLDHGVHVGFQGLDAVHAVVLGNGSFLRRVLLGVGLAEEVVHDLFLNDNRASMVALSRLAWSTDLAENDFEPTSVFFQSPLVLKTVFTISGLSTSKILGPIRTKGPYWAWRRSRTKWKLPRET